MHAVKMAGQIASTAKTLRTGRLPVMPVITFGLLLVAAFADIGHTPFLLLDALIGLFLIGGHFGMHSICGILSPSVYRGNGAGWATSVARSDRSLGLW